MDISTTKSECLFCAKFSDASSPHRKWYDEELHSPSDFVVVPGLGPFVEGHLMILTREHYHSMSQLPVPKLMELASLKREVREVLMQHYGSPICFEHGPSVLGSSGGSCIDHAHFQFHPLDIDIFATLSKRHKIREIGNLIELTEFAATSKPYLFFENQLGHMFVCEANNVPSQYLRRLIAAELGIPDQWDYAIFPNYELIASTISRLKPWPEQLI